ncbi:MAG: PilC/PilY family type IV pilus protein, partial [Gammaproteobacteria bacterium]
DDANAEAATTIVTREQSQDRLEGLIVKKRISNVLSDFSISTNQQFKLDPSTVSPWSTERVYIYNLMKSNKIRFGTTLGGGDLSTARYGADMRISVKVCDPHAIPSDPIHSLEPNCVAYSNGDFVWYKPEGLLQKYRNRARFGMMSLPLDEDYQGGVLRADIKYIGEKQVLSTGKTIENPNVEVAADGTFNTDPDHLADNNEYFDTQNSGVVNFINKFTQSGYRYYDTNSQIYYESLHYYKHNGSTPEYFPNSPPKVSTRFPFIRGSQWRDPIQSSCQKNFIVSIGDGYQWAGTRLPGTHYTSKMYKGDPMADGSYGEPGNADPDINVTALTNQLGIMEGISGKPFRIWCTSTGPWCGYLDPVVVNLGETLLSNRGETHYLAGLSYYGNTRDVRSDLSGKQTIKHFVVDVIENNDGDYQKHNLFNPLWMAGKYGFSEDVNQDGVLQVNEWDINRDGIPDGYIPADNPEQMYLGLSNALEYSVRAEKRAFSTMAASPEPLSDGAYVLYQSTFVSEEWWGDVQAIRFKLSDPSQKTVLWSAKDRLDRIDPANRNLYAVNPSAQQKKRGINLTWSSLTPSQQAALNAMIQVNDNLGENRLEYLRGDRSQEIAQGGAFRDRKSRLGDIVNSDTRFVGKWNYGYSELPGADGAAYAAYRASSAYLARPQMLLVGANDGFLHAFDAASGTELFGVMPNAVFNALSTLTSHFYSHHYFVDGQVSVSDAYINDQWTTVALASVGAGGRSVFAIDIGHPNRFSSTDILWEFDTTTDPDMGYVLGEAVTARLAGGQWVAIFPNGPGNQRGRAILYIVDLETGQLLKKVDFGRGSGQKENALFAPSVIDLNLDGIADTVYAGDAKGNLWKIDISGKTPDLWRSSFLSKSNVPQPLFTACTQNVCNSGNRQAITNAPRVGLHPEGGVLVYVGTGQFFDWYDRAVSVADPVNTFYGIWDNGQPVGGRDHLLQQRFLALGTTGKGLLYRTSSDEPIEWYDG